MLVDEAEHEDEDNGQKDTVEDLRQDAELDQREVGDEDDRCSRGEQQAVEPVEELRFLERLVESAFEAEAFAALKRPAAKRMKA